MSNKKVRNAEIDFLRLIFSIAVVFYHCKTFLTPNGGPEIFPRGAIAVEFFFILSGFLMARSAQKVGPNPDVGRETCKYIVSRYRMLWLYMIPAAILLVAELISSSGSLRTAPRYAAQGLAELLCLSQAGLFSQDVNTPAWYLSALILCSWLLFPLLIWKPSAFKKIVAPLISVFLLGYLQQAYHGIGKATQYDLFITRGMIRGLAEMCLGCAAFECYQWFKMITFSKFGRICVTVLEVALWTVVFWYAQFSKQGLHVFMVIFILAANIVIVFSQQSYVHKLFSFPAHLTMLGDFSLALYLNHMVVRRVIQRTVTSTSYLFRSFLLLILSSILSIAMVVFVRLLQRVWNNHLRAICRQAFLSD